MPESLSLVFLTTLKELVLTAPGDGTLSVSVAVGKHFAWPDAGAAETMINHGWAEYTNQVTPGIQDSNNAAVVGPHPPHPQDETRR